MICRESQCRVVEETQCSGVRAWHDFFYQTPKTPSIITTSSHISHHFSIPIARHDSVSYFFMRVFFRLCTPSRKYGSPRLSGLSSHKRRAPLPNFSSHDSATKSVASDPSILDHGAVPGLFKTSRNQTPLTDKYNPTTSKLLSRTASGPSLLLTNELLKLYNHEIRDKTKAVRETLIVRGTASGSPDLLEEWKPIIALWAVVYLLRRAPIALCELLHFLYNQYNLTHRHWVLAMKSLYYYFLEQNLSSKSIPPEFYKTLLHSDTSEPLKSLLRVIPAYTLFYHCPEDMRPSLQSIHSEVWEHMKHWERTLLNAQKSARQGDFEIALKNACTLQHDQRWSTEFVNTIYSILDSADRSEPDQYTVESIVAIATRYRQHPHVWIRLINFAEHWKNIDALHRLVRAVSARRLGVGIQIHLVQALDSLHARPLEISGETVSLWAEKNDVYATMLLHSWQNYFLRTSSDSDIYSRLMPIYRQFFDPSILIALGLPCPGSPSDQHTQKHTPNAVVLATMLKAYFRDKEHDAQLTLNIYRRFRELTAIQPEYMARIVNSEHTEVLITFLSAISKSPQDTLDLCVGIVSEIVQLINTSKTTTSSSRNPPPSPRRRPLHESKTWLVLLQALTRASLLPAAAKILAEIRRNHPLAYHQASAYLLEAYAKAGRAKETHALMMERQAMGHDFAEREWEPLGRGRRGRQAWSTRGEFVPRSDEEKELLADVSVLPERGSGKVADTG
jgi:hypothetical protein